MQTLPTRREGGIPIPRIAAGALVVRVRAPAMIEAVVAVQWLLPVTDRTYKTSTLFLWPNSTDRLREMRMKAGKVKYPKKNLDVI